MGCCESGNRRQHTIDTYQLFYKKSSYQFQLQVEQMLRCPQLKTDGDAYPKNFLAYALTNNLPVKFKILHEKIGMSIEEMDSYLEKEGKSAITILCESGSLELLKYYLPHYLRKKKCDLNYTINFNDEEEGDCENVYSPVQIACMRHHYHIIRYLLKKFKHPPPEFDINFQSEPLGESCVFVAAKLGSFHMLKYLYDNNANFNVLNKRKETVLQVTAVYSSANTNVKYIPAFRFLIETAKVDPLENYEEILLVLQDQTVLQYYLEVLRMNDVHAKVIDEPEYNERVVWRTDAKENLLDKSIHFNRDYISRNNSSLLSSIPSVVDHAEEDFVVPELSVTSSNQQVD